MKNTILRNQSGSILVVVVVIGAVITGLMVSSITGLERLAKSRRVYGVSQENMRVAGELGKLFVLAYENYKSTGVCTPATQTLRSVGNGGLTKFCFNTPTGASPGTQTAYCTGVQYGQAAGNSMVCIDLTVGPNVIAQNGDPNVLRFNASWQPEHHSIFEGLLPSAFGDWGEGGPAVSWPGGPNQFNNIPGNQCTGMGVPDQLCQKCDAVDNICIKVTFCSVDSASLLPGAGCTPYTEEFMIQR